MSALNIRISEDLRRKIQARAKGQGRKLSDQARRYLEIALVAEDNPDLPFIFIEVILEAKAEREAGLLEPLERSVQRRHLS